MEMKASKKDSNMSVSCCPVGIGTIIAILLSWSVNHSIIWAIIHGILSWLYVIYYVIFVHC